MRPFTKKRNFNGIDPQMVPKSPQDRPQIVWLRFYIVLKFQFGSLLGLNIGTKSIPKSIKICKSTRDLPRRPQEVPGSPQEFPKGSREVSKSLRRGGKEAARGSQEVPKRSQDIPRGLQEVPRTLPCMPHIGTAKKYK